MSEPNQSRTDQSGMEKNMEKRFEKAAKKLLRMVLRRSAKFPDDGTLRELLGSIFEDVDISFTKLVKGINRYLVKYGLIIVRITDTGDLDWWAVLPTQLLMALFPNAKDVYEAQHYFHLCVALNAGWQIHLTEEERNAIRGRCRMVEKITNTIMPKDP